MLRRPIAAGKLYPADPEELKKLIESFKGKVKTTLKEKAVACLLPHADYAYSGSVAVETLSSIEVPQTCIILGPNHSGFGEKCSLIKDGQWQTPLGNVKIDTALAEELLKNSKYLLDDSVAHIQEYSIETILPLIQEVGRRDFTFVPIALAWAGELVYKDLTEAIVKSIRTLKKDVLIIATSDMTHHESQVKVKQKDEDAIGAILKLNEQEFLKKIKEYQISVCGYIPIVLMIMVANQLGAKRSFLAAYQTSGDATKDYSSVVGYAGIVIQ